MGEGRRNLQDGWTTEMIVLTACLGLGGFMLGALISHGTLYVDPFHSDVDCRRRRLALQNKIAEASRRLLNSDSQELTSVTNSAWTWAQSWRFVPMELPRRFALRRVWTRSFK